MKNKMINRTPKIFIILLTLSVLKSYAQDKGSFVDDRDNKSYQWVKIGDQIWMTENLAYLPSVNKVDESQFEGNCYYVFGYDGKDVVEAKRNVNYEKLGVLYNWKAATESCPSGWHIPEEGEWRALESFLGMSKEEVPQRGWRKSGSVGKKVKSVEGWKISGGDNSESLNILPAGCRGYGGFDSEGYCAYFWSATPVGGDNAWRRGFCTDDDGSYREEDRRYFGLSVRCVKNN